MQPLRDDQERLLAVDRERGHGRGIEDLEGFATSGPRGVESTGCNLIVGYLVRDAGRPELVRPCLERVLAEYRHTLGRSVVGEEDLEALIGRIEKDLERLG